MALYPFNNIENHQQSIIVVLVFKIVNRRRATTDYFNSQSSLTARRFSGRSSKAVRSQESSSEANLRMVWIKLSGRPLTREKERERRGRYHYVTNLKAMMVFDLIWLDLIGLDLIWFYAYDGRHENAANGAVENRIADTDNVNNDIATEDSHQMRRHSLPEMQQKRLHL